ncbi:MAG: hypothetical protein GY816_10165 [Cytophagales bacterium]|nr:hypothetical protein [Cytophagales bacterium]
MLKYIKVHIISFALIVVMLTGCFPDSEVEGVVTPDDNAVVSVEQITTEASVAETDTVWIEVSLDKPVAAHSIAFTVEFDSSSTADSHDYEIVGDMELAAYATSATIGIIALDDEEIEGYETLVLTVGSIEDDEAWNWQLNTEASSTLTASIGIVDRSFGLSWDEAVYVYSGDGNTYSVCDFGLDLDIYVANSDFSIAEWGGATGACPELAGFLALPAGDYDIYVDFWAVGTDLTAENPPADFEIPFIVSFANYSGGVDTHAGTFLISDEGASTTVGTLTVNADLSFSVTYN